MEDENRCRRGGNQGWPVIAAPYALSRLKCKFPLDTIFMQWRPLRHAMDDFHKCSQIPPVIALLFFHEHHFNAHYGLLYSQISLDTADAA